MWRWGNVKIDKPAHMADYLFSWRAVICVEYLLWSSISSQHKE